MHNAIFICTHFYSRCLLLIIHCHWLHVIRYFIWHSHIHQLSVSNVYMNVQLVRLKSGMMRKLVTNQKRCIHSCNAFHRWQGISYNKVIDGSVAKSMHSSARHCVKKCTHCCVRDRCRVDRCARTFKNSAHRCRMWRLIRDDARARDRKLCARVQP